MTTPGTTPRSDAELRQAAVLTDMVLTTAGLAVDKIGQPGAGTRFHTLEASIESLAAADPVIAVIIAAARWTDRYGSAGAPARLADLHDVVEAMRDTTAPAERVNGTPVTAAGEWPV